MLPYFLAPAQYHRESHGRQQVDITPAVLKRASIQAARCVVDVGCGAGQTLRLIDGLNACATLVGVDPDGEALRSGLSCGDRIQFLQGEGERLPLADNVASHVICRVAINYMHHARALREFHRVLAAGGKIVLSFIGPGYALKQVLRPVHGGFRQRLGNLKDLGAGFILQTLGRQGPRGSFWGRSVPYLSWRQLRRQVRDLNCEITWAEAEDTYWGLRTVWWVVIRKTPS